MMDIAIREAFSDDLDTLIQCHGLFMQHHVDCDKRFALRPGADDAWRERIAAALNDPTVLVSVAVAGESIVGCAYTLIKPGAMDYGPEKIGYLCDVFVQRGYRRDGIARRFVAEAMNWLRLRGISTIEASWAENAEEARRTWTALGFEPISVSGRLVLPSE